MSTLVLLERLPARGTTMITPGGQGSSLTSVASNVKSYIRSTVERSQKNIQSACQEKDSLKRYSIRKEVGRGNFGVVFEAVDRSTGEVVAIKEVALEMLPEQYRLVEMEIGLQVDFPFVLKAYRSFLKDNSTCILVAEFIKGWNMLQVFHAATMNSEKFPENELRFFAAEIALGIQYLHEMQILHRDIALDNILVDENFNVKLADFGISKKLPKGLTRTNSWMGRPSVMAPEYSAPYDHSVDWWSYGVILYQLLGGPLHYLRLHRDSTLLSKEVVENYRLMAVDYLPKHVSREAVSLVRQLLHRYTSERLGGRRHTFYQSIITHPFFAGVDWMNLLQKKAVFTGADRLRQRLKELETQPGELEKWVR